MTNSGAASGKVMVDSSSWIELFRKNGNPDVSRHVGELLRSGRAAICDMVRLELWRGIRNEQERVQLEEIESLATHFPTDAEAWEQCVAISKAARLKGQRPPAADVVIVGTAKRHGLAIEHVDKHLAVLIAID